MTERFLDPEIEDRASKDDRQWFLSNPQRRYRLRRCLPGELGYKDPDPYTDYSDLSRPPLALSRFLAYRFFTI